MEGWERYVVTQGFSDRETEILRRAMDKVWQDSDAKLLIKKAFDNNTGQKVLIHHPDITTVFDFGEPKNDFETALSGKKELTVGTEGTRTSNRAGHMSVSFDFEKRLYSHDGKNYAVSADAMLFHEFYHLANEEGEMARRLLPHFSYHFPESAGRLEAAVSRPPDFENIVEQGLAPELDELRHQFSGLNLKKHEIHGLYMFGDLDKSETEALYGAMDDGLTITLKDIEKDYGPLSWYALIRFGKEILPEGSISESLDEHLVAYDAQSLEHEQDVVNHVDSEYRAERSIPPRKSYSNVFRQEVSRQEDKTEELVQDKANPSVPVLK